MGFADLQRTLTLLVAYAACSSALFIHM